MSWRSLVLKVRKTCRVLSYPWDRNFSRENSISTDDAELALSLLFIFKNYYFRHNWCALRRIFRVRFYDLCQHCRWSAQIWGNLKTYLFSCILISSLEYRISMFHYFLDRKIRIEYISPETQSNRSDSIKNMSIPYKIKKIVSIPKFSGKKRIFCLCTPNCITLLFNGCFQNTDTFVCIMPIKVNVHVECPLSTVFAEKISG